MSTNSSQHRSVGYAPPHSVHIEQPGAMESGRREMPRWQPPPIAAASAPSRLCPAKLRNAAAAYLPNTTTTNGPRSVWNASHGELLYSFNDWQWGDNWPLLSLMSTTAWASNSSESNSMVPVRAAWCSAENLRTKQREHSSSDGKIHTNNCCDASWGERIKKHLTDVCICLF